MILRVFKREAQGFYLGVNDQAAREDIPQKRAKAKSPNIVK